MATHSLQNAPEIDACHWLNCSGPLVLNNLRGKVVVLHAFQMLCPGCVVHGLPQATSIHALFSPDDVQVIGIHTVFEHHDVMTVQALKAFVHEYRLQFPIAVDTPGQSRAEPNTMRLYQLKGTPSLVLIDKAGRIRLNHFGRLSDMQVGNLIGQLVQEKSEDIGDQTQPAQHVAADDTTMKVAQRCDEESCQVK